MTATAKCLYRGPLTAALLKVYTTPAATTTVVTDVFLTNAGASTSIVELAFGGIDVLALTSLAVGGYLQQSMRQVLAAGTLIHASATVENAHIHICGVEIT